MTSRQLYIAVFVCMIGFLFMFEPAHAQIVTNAGGDVTTGGATPRMVIDRGVIAGQPAVLAVCPATGANQGFTQRVVGCVEAAISTGVNQFLTRFMAFMRNTINTAIMFAIVVYGVRLSLGMVQKPAAKTFMLMVKIGMIWTFMMNFMDIYDGAMTGVREALSWASSLAGTSATFYCPDVAARAAAGDTTLLWSRIDCIFGRMLGVVGPNVVLKSGLFGILFGLLFSGSLGFLIFMLGIIFVGTILASIARAVHIYIMSFLGVGLMMAFSPLFIPCALFYKTKAFFDKWLKLTMSLLLQPLFLFMYLAMMLTTFEVLVYSGPTSFYRIIAGTQVGNTAPRFQCPPAPGFCLSAFMWETGSLTNQLALGMVIDLTPPTEQQGKASPDPNDPKTNTGFFGSMWADFKSTVANTFDLGNVSINEILSNMSIKVPITLVDFVAMYNSRGGAPLQTPPSIQAYADAQAGKGTPMSMQAIFKWVTVYWLVLQSFICILMAYVMYAILKYIPDLAHHMAGGVFNSPNLSRISPIPIEDKVGAAVDKFGQQFAPKQTSSRR